MFSTFNPATGEVLSDVAEGDREDIDRAVKAARAAFETGPWSKMTASERGRAIWRLGDLIEKHLEDFAQIESLDNGKPLKVARAADVPLAAELFRYMAGWATKIEGNTIPLSVPYTPGAKYLAYTLREPVGVPKRLVPLAHCSGRQAMRTSDSGGIASMTLETTERRCYSRTQLRSKKLVSLQGTGSQNFYSCKNVGLGGMLIEGLEPMPVGSMVRFAVRVGIDTVRG